jgi:lipopolysaccharide transport system ATP-binding protein
MNIIEVSNLSKCYRIGSPADLDAAENNKFIRLLKGPLNNYRKYKSLYTFTEAELSDPRPRKDILWALRDISFAVQPGEAVGLVGANGAGKSTLLKVISRITPPTSGSVLLRGRVSCLIEVGTGFHPELTGRENIYLSSTVLGMRKREVDRKIDEIIDFSGVEKFIDTPVKRYSSGMSVRLAFAVMAHLEPEILVIDEVLAVGDAEFQRKCLNKMGSVGKEGRTVLFVSHNMAAVTRLCDRALLIRNGQVILDSSAADVVHHHVSAGTDDPTFREWRSLDDSPGDDSVRLRAVRIVNESGSQISAPVSSEPMGIQMTYDVLEEGHLLSPYITVVSEAGIDLFSSASQSNTETTVEKKPGRYVNTVWIPANLLAEGTHYVRVVMRSIKKKSRPFSERDVIAFNLIDHNEFGPGASWWEGRASGIIRPTLNWSSEYIPPAMILED